VLVTKGEAVSVGEPIAEKAVGKAAKLQQTLQALHFADAFVSA
jgi:hypothetical protein